MNKAWLALAAVVLSACASPLAPTVVDTTSPAPLIPASIALTGGTATSVNEVLLNVTVFDAGGKGVPGAAVTLTTTSGTFNHATVTTSTNGTGQAILTTTVDATVTATLGSLTTTARAVAYPKPVLPVYVDPPPPPPPVIVPPPATCANTPSLCPPPQLAVQLTCTAVAHGTPTPCNVSVTWGNTPIPATAITQVQWNWGDGFADTTVPPTAPINSHAFVNAGSYTVFAQVTSDTPAGSKTAFTSKALVIP